MKKYIVGITGASGSIYGIRAAEELLKQNNEVYLTITDNGKKVMSYETGYEVGDIIEKLKNIGKINLCNNNDLFEPIASGSFKVEGMVVAPCSMSAAGRMANGISLNLLDRAADVCIKEKRKLILVPREAPLSNIHLENMLKLSKSGAVILPASPGFYIKPQSVDDMINFIVSRILDSLNIENNLCKKWGA
ncbi:4-hydroxy-3-polyprenylbenzoate decarboxylase [Caloramator quimbayensis]|uniref:Flavin prenyltransferase UbiX n=1 Tax=Caloramator quimbayensis TaxID=1147123 RepID=A0A1T4XE81_9CLOT|nr:flavin prenyltransferase UbiX [Caloramator quimbayensis]SKA87874.1 4-hydroxy-3-polyprenylbenzoate decarboxylase [Caloramator quimbayensis]